MLSVFPVTVDAAGLNSSDAGIKIIPSSTLIGNNNSNNQTNNENVTTAQNNNNSQVISEQKPKDYSAQDVGAGMFQKGMDLVIYEAADGISSIWKDNFLSQELKANQNITDEYGASRGLIFTFITMNPHPDQVEPIKKFEENTIATWAFLFIVFAFGMPIRNVIARASHSTYSNVFGEMDLSDNRYIVGAVLVISAFFAPKLVLLSIDICTTVSKYAMLNVLEYIAPSTENSFLYLMMAIGETLTAVFFVVRPWIIDIVYAASRLLAVWYFLGIWKEEVTWIWSKYFKVLLLQPVCIFVTCACIITIKWAGMENMPGVYIILFLFIAYINYKWMFGNFGVRTVSRAARYSTFRR
jgi:hypothetical protein